MIDTHAHIRPGEELKIEGLEYVVLSASNLDDSAENIRLAMTNERLLPAVGVHPQDIPDDIDSAISKLNEMLSENKLKTHDLTVGV